MATDVVQRFVEATVSILRANTTIQGLLGRTTGMVRAWGDIAEAQLPVIAYLMVVAGRGGPVGDTRRVQIQFSALVEGDGAAAKCNALLEALELALTQPLYAAAGLDAAPIPGASTRLPGDVEREGPRSLWRADVDMEFMVTK